ncbi:MAG: patatin-like phospholipase family protein, partial [Chloroflexota bacterium]
VGMSLDAIEKEMRSFKPSSMYSLPDNEPAIGSLSNIEKYLERIFNEHYGDRFADRDNKRPQFEDLDIPLAVVATDLVTRREVVLDSGDLIDAIRATIAIPVLFPPVKIGDWALVDGGLVNSVPFDIARARGATHTIAIALGNSSPYGTPREAPTPTRNGKGALGIRWAEVLDGNLFDRALYQATRDPLWDVVTAVFDIVTVSSVDLRMAISPPDVIIRPQIGTIGLLDFHTIDAGIEAGRAAVQREAKDIEKILTALAEHRSASEETTI